MWYGDLVGRPYFKDWHGVDGRFRLIDYVWSIRLQDGSGHEPEEDSPLPQLTIRSRKLLAPICIILYLLTWNTVFDQFLCEIIVIILWSGHRNIKLYGGGSPSRISFCDWGADCEFR